ncbi:MAG: 3-phosphoshikimate 1-carboxyvinyltransferase [Pseudomonadota bacterium]|nr:3-phosphoshikimate 1-carboxyvinyltransferase [Pseudomonadota bacterium]
MRQDAVTSIEVSSGSKLCGVLASSGDKSISHRALIVAALSAGRSRLTGLLMSDDVRCTIGVLRQLGTQISDSDGNSVVVYGTGIGGLMDPVAPLNFGNSGTAARLLMGVVAGNPVTAVFVGDESLSSRPMERVVDPLRKMGASIDLREGAGLPATVGGRGTLTPIDYRLPVASAQVKSSILLAGLHCPGVTSVREDRLTRDHTENLLAKFGADIQVEELDGGYRVCLSGQPELISQDLEVVGDPSSAAFPLVAALLTEGSEVCVKGVGINRTRIGLFDCLREMGADLQVVPRGIVGGEPVGDITARTSALRGIKVVGERAPSMIDEYPILAVAAAHADGVTVMQGLAELRVKESNRFSSIIEGLTKCGVKVEEEGDALTIFGGEAKSSGGRMPKICTHGDHRIAMAFFVMGLTCPRPIMIDDMSMVATSYPRFIADMEFLGVRL